MNSHELLMGDEFRNAVNKLSIRYHYTLKARPHFDYALGNEKELVCADFIIVKPITDVEKKKGYNLPSEFEEKTLLFMPIHDVEYLIEEIGKRRPIKSGYGRGWWKIVIQTRADVWIEDNVIFLRVRDLGGMDVSIFTIKPKPNEKDKYNIQMLESWKTWK